jgi:hypothetical protein
MAPRSWFDSEKLLPRERLARIGPARLRVNGPPHWWEGMLILTNDRLFFLPEVDDASVGEAAFWLADLTAVDVAGRGRISVVAGRMNATFELIGPMLFAGRRARLWLREITRGRLTAVPRTLVNNVHRATG